LTPVAPRLTETPTVSIANRFFTCMTISLHIQILDSCVQPTHNPNESLHIRARMRANWQSRNYLAMICCLPGGTSRQKLQREGRPTLARATGATFVGA
jgi:hypothetical protein